MFVRILGAFLGVIILGLFAVGIGCFLLISISNQPGPEDLAVFFQIQKNQSLESIADKLEELELIENSLLFQAYAYVQNQNRNVRFGNFEIPGNSSSKEILEILVKPGTADDRYRVQTILSIPSVSVRVSERKPFSDRYSIIHSEKIQEDLPRAIEEITINSNAVKYFLTIVEGLTNWQVSEHLITAPFLSGEVETLPSEGLLAPSTYPIKEGTNRQSIIDQLYERQKQIIAEEWQNRSDNTPITSPEDALTLASIIEKETGIEEERVIIGSVFANRLRNDWPLQADPTVVYGVSEGKGILGRGIRKSELKNDTPYNTYIHKGLPPTPIANPSRASIRAALNPVESPYFFFVADGVGGHKFATTYEEHQKNVREWRKLE